MAPHNQMSLQDNLIEKASNGRNPKMSHKTKHDPRKRKGRLSDDSSSGAEHSDDNSGTDENEDEEDEDADDESDDTEILAPPGGFGLGKGKRPAIHIEHESDDEMDVDDAHTHRAGALKTGGSVAHPAHNKKKRTYSNVSVGSVLHEDENINGTIKSNGLLSPDFPRKKMQRRLSNTPQGLLKYDEDAGRPDLSVDNEAGGVAVSENAIASSDEDEEDEDYTGVDLISDSEEDEPTLEMLEEQIIMEEELFTPGRRGSLDSDIFDLDMSGNFFVDQDFLNAATLDVHSAFDSAWETNTTKERSSERRKDSNGSIKRVRFEDSMTDSDDSDSTTSELDSTLFPDLFVQQDKLDPSFRQLIENDDGDQIANVSSDEGSYWEFGEEETVAAVAAANKLLSDNSDVDSDAGSSGYESDEGDTTDEEAPPPVTVHSPQSLLHRPSSANATKSPFPRVPKRRSRGGQNGPIWGSFEVNKTKPVAMIDRYARTLVLWPASEPTGSAAKGGQFFSPSGASSVATSPRTSTQQLQGEDSDLSEGSANPQMQLLDVMMTGAFTADLLRGQVVGPPEAFFPSIDSDDNDMTDFTSFETDDEGGLDIDAFIDFGDDMCSSENDECDVGDETPFPSTPGAASTIAHFGSTPGAETPTPTPHDPMSAMLERFDRGPGVVTAFRSNQSRYHAASRQHQDPALRALASKPVRSGKSAETVISPLRKRRPVQRKRAMQSSPLAGRVSKLQYSP